MKQITDKEANNLQKEIDHILDSGVNSIRLIEMIDMFLDRRNKGQTLPIPVVMQQSEQFFALLRYVMPEVFTDFALKNIVNGFIDKSK